MVASRACGALFFFLVLSVAGSAFAQIASSTDVESAVRAEFADVPVMIDIARCESKFRQFTDAGNPLYGGYGGRMVGIYQVYSDIHRTYASSIGMDIETTEGNIAYARHLYDREGTRPWNSSMSCWQGAASIATSTSESVPQTQTHAQTLTLDLSTGMDHPQVRTLQIWLNGNGFAITDSGPGSPGNETTLYGALTRAAVQRFQCARGIVCGGDGFSSGYGVFGPRTRASLLGMQTTTATTPAPAPANPQPAATNDNSTEERQRIAELEAQIAALKVQLAALLAR